MAKQVSESVRIHRHSSPHPWPCPEKEQNDDNEDIPVSIVNACYVPDDLYYNVVVIVNFLENKMVSESCKRPFVAHHEYAHACYTLG